MIHYSCDRCQKTIDDQSLRYEVNLEMAAKLDDCEAEDNQPAEAMQELLSSLEEEEIGEELINDVYRRQRFDLCSKCYHEIKENPLSMAKQTTVRFSQN